jgi:Holliday junction DNA helicase RuvA
MITRITGLLNRVLDDEVRLQVGALEYQVLVPEFVRRSVQHRLGQELTFHTSHFFDGDPSRGKVVPRLVGFASEHELEFFELFCTVNGVGTRKALKALARPIRDIADAIQRQDAKYLTTLPGVGGPTAEKIVATLRRKVTRFALAPAPRGGDDGEASEPAATATVEGNVLDDAYQALLGIGHGPADARALLDRALASGKSFSSADEVLLEIYQRK